MTMPAEPAKRENVFTRKIGPIPMWGWVAIVAVLLFAWRWYSSKNAASQNAAQQAATANASQVPQFVNQTFTTVQPPSAPSMPHPAPPPTPGQPTGRIRPPTPVPQPGLVSSIPPETQIGSGYAPAGSQAGSATPIVAGGTAYNWVNPGQAQAAVQAGIPLYYQPKPGQFVQATNQQLGQGTPLYQKSIS